VGPVVCMITDRRRLGPHAEAALISRVVAASRAGVHLIQIRERDMPDNALLPLVARAVEAVRGTRARVLVNDRIDVAIAAGAHGVQLRADSVSAARVRAVAPPSFVIGRSVHSREEVARARGEDVLDYLLFGTVFETSSKPGRVAAGIQDLAEAVDAAGPLPVLAVGGVTLDTIGRLAATGCSGFAAIGQFADCPEGDLVAAVTGALTAWENPR
jgi:thiamine-phosphate diphosphorylase